MVIEPTALKFTPPALRIVRRLLAILALACAPVLAPAAPNAEAIARLETLPAANPYRAALLRLENLPEADRAALEAWTDYYPDSGEPAPVLNADQKALADEFRGSLIAAASAPSLDSDAWPRIPNPHDPDNVTTITVVSVSSLRELARIATKSADTLPADEAVATYTAVAQLGRQQRAGLTLIEQLTGVAIEGVAVSDAARRLDEYSPDGLRRLSDAWTTLHPLPTNAEAFSGERDAFFQPMLERIIVPGLHALLADPEAGKKDSDGSDAKADDDDPFRDLRLSGLVRLGPGEEQISLENTRTHATTVLHSGRPADGLELVSIDFENHRALIRRGDHEALVNLRTNRVVDLDRAARGLRLMFAFLDLGSESGDENDALAKTLALVRAHPGGLDGYARDLLGQYQAAIDKQVILAESAKFPLADDSAEPAKSADPFVTVITPVFGKLGRTFNNAATYPAMLQAAIHHRLAALGQNAPDSPAPADPWSADGAGFAHEASSDGGFVLRSRYEVAPDALLTFKFAAPDAGYQRPK